MKRSFINHDIAEVRRKTLPVAAIQLGVPTGSAGSSLSWRTGHGDASADGFQSEVLDGPPLPFSIYQRVTLPRHTSLTFTGPSDSAVCVCVCGGGTLSVA